MVPAKTPKMITNRPEPSNHTITTKKLIVKKYCKKYRDKNLLRSCPRPNDENSVSENKENIQQNVPKCTKKPISYTVLFENTSNPDDNQCHRQQQPAKKPSSNEIVYIASKTRTVTPQQPDIKLTDVADQWPSLQVRTIKKLIEISIIFLY